MSVSATDKAADAGRQSANADAPSADAGLSQSATRARLALITMGLVGVAASLVALLLVFRAGRIEREAQLRALVASQARLIEAVARFDAVESQDASPSGAWLATLGQVASGQASLAGVAHEAMTLAIVGIVDGRLVTHVRGGLLLAPNSPPVEVDTPLVATDLFTPSTLSYRGSDGTDWFQVVEPVPALGMAVVARMNLDILNRPIQRAGAVGGAAALTLIVLGVFLVRRTSYRTLQDFAAELKRRQRAEVLLEGHQADLERAVAERTTELQRAQVQLLQSARFATLGQVTAKVSHELRNPLATVRNSVHSLRSKMANTSDSATRIFDRIDRNVLRCDRIIAELLAYTRPRAAARELVDVATVLGTLSEDYLAGMEGSVVWEVQAETFAFVDPEDLRRIVINLLSNALDASTGENCQVKIAVQNTGKELLVRVSDNAGGMPPEVLARAAEPLFSTKGFGVGLGLPIVCELVERNGGRFTLESKNGVGTVAEFTIPGPST
jgi:signal transduction histidine kinase